MGKQKHERYFLLSFLWQIFAASEMQIKLLDYQLLQKERYGQ